MTSTIGIETEPILSETLHRFCLFPIKYPGIFDFFIKHQASFWTVSEVDLKSDRADYEKLTPDERNFIAKVLAFFANADGIVNENLAQRFMYEVTVPEARQFYGFQVGIETIHSHMYGVMIDTLITDPDEREKLFQASGVPSVAKGQWALRWLSKTCSFVNAWLRLLAWKASSFPHLSVPSTI